MQTNTQQVTVQIKNAQVVDGHPEQIEMTVTGSATVEDAQISIQYTEFDEEMHKIETVVRVRLDEFVSVTRSGAYESQMLFQKNKRNTTVYSTPYGDLPMGMYTKSIHNTLPLTGPMNGTLSFAYTTDFAGQNTIENEMTLQVKAR